MTVLRSPSLARRGNALVMVMAFLVLIGGLAMALVDSSIGNLVMQRHRQARDLTFISAESAANEALASLRALAARQPGLLQSVSDGGSAPDILYDPAAPSVVDPADPFYPVAVSATWSNPAVETVVSCRRVQTTKAVYDQLVEADRKDLRRTFIVTALARHGVPGARDYQQCMVEMRVYTVSGIAQGLLANESYRFFGSATVDWYDSRAGAYAPPASPLTYALLASNSLVDVDKPTNVSSAPSDEDNAQSPMLPVVIPDDAPSYRPIPAPVLVGGVPTVVLDAGQSPYYVPAIDGGYAGVRFQVGGGGTVNLYCGGTLSGMDSPLAFADATSRLVIRQSDYNNPLAPVSERLNGNTAIGSAVAPGRFTVLSAFSGEVTFNGNAECGGVLYYPSATFKLNGTFDYYGALVARHFGVAPAGGGAAYSVQRPAAGASWPSDSTASVYWTPGDPDARVDIDLSTDGGATWSTVASGTADDGVHAVDVPSVTTAGAVVRVRATDGSGSGTSPTFSISPTAGNPDDGRVNGNFAVHYDIALNDLPELSSLQVDQWRTAPIPAALLPAGW